MFGLGLGIGPGGPRSECLDRCQGYDGFAFFFLVHRGTWHTLRAQMLAMHAVDQT